jgi:putative spermidine/putrescine transport system substrate-binding protein
MTLRITRRQVAKTALAALAAPTILIPRAWAEDKSIYVGIYAAQQGEFVRKHIVPKFEADYKCKVYTTEGVTLGQIAALRATRSNPKYSAMFMDDIGIDLATSEGLLDPLPFDKMPNAERLFKRFIFTEGHGAAFAISTAGWAYNPQNGPTIKSYADLWDARFKGRILLQSQKNTQSVYMLVAAAALALGKPWKEAQYNLDAAWAKMRDLKPNILTLYDANSTVMMIPQGQADLAGIEYSKQIFPYTVAGAALDMTFPKEGAFAGVNCLSLPKNAPEPELGVAFLNRMLDPEVQQALASATLTAGTISGLSFTPDIAKYIPYPEAKMDAMQLFTCDWKAINPIRPSLVEKYNQTFAS